MTAVGAQSLHDAGRWVTTMPDLSLQRHTEFCFVPRRVGAGITHELPDTPARCFPLPVPGHGHASSQPGPPNHQMTRQAGPPPTAWSMTKPAESAEIRVHRVRC